MTDEPEVESAKHIRPMTGGALAMYEALDKILEAASPIAPELAKLAQRAMALAAAEQQDFDSELSAMRQLRQANLWLIDMNRQLNERAEVAEGQLAGLSVSPMVMTIRDWRLSDDGDEEDLAPEHRGDFRIEIDKGSYDNVVLTMTTPQGHQSLLRLEADEGVIKTMINCPSAEDPSEIRDEVDVIGRITPQGYLAESNYSNQPTVRFDDDKVEVIEAKHPGLCR